MLLAASDQVNSASCFFILVKKKNSWVFNQFFGQNNLRISRGYSRCDKGKLFLLKKENNPSK